MQRQVLDKTDDTIERLEGLLHELTNRRPVTQAVIAVESSDRSFRWIGGKGTTVSNRPVSENTPIFVASIDKLYNATIVMMLSEIGLLDVDEPIGAYLPPSITRGLHRYRGLDLSEKITVRHLLTHTSGLADWLEDYPKGGVSLIDKILKEGDRMFTIEELAAYVRDHLRPHFPPQNLAGEHPKARYSDTNFMLIIAIIEAVTGQPLHEVHQHMLHEPLRLRQTYFPRLDEPTQSTMDPITLRARGEPLKIPLLIESVRGLYSSVTDMMTFMRAFIKGGLFQKPGTLAAMQSNWHRFGFPKDQAALRSPGWPIEYGIGLMRFRMPLPFTLLSPVPSVLGHTGSTGCWLFYCPELDTFLSGGVDEVIAGAVPFRIVPKILKVLRTLERPAYK